ATKPFANDTKQDATPVIGKTCYIRVKDKNTASALKGELLSVIGRHPGSIRMHFTIQDSQENYWLAPKYAIDGSQEAIAYLVEVYGAENVVVK
ncbi:MAG: hypothetical protein B7Z25_05620, partial [Aerococcus viridans]